MPLPRLPSPPSVGRRIGATAVGIATILLLIPSLLVFNLIQTASLLLRPFSDRAFRAVNRWAADTWWGWCAATTSGLHGTEVIFSGDAPRDENAIVLSNHQSMTDILVMFQIARPQGRLGDLKFFVKDVVKWVPGVGWGMIFLDCLFVKRQWAADRDSIRQAFQRILDHRIPIWLVSYVEGTRLKPWKLDIARRFAAERGYPTPRHVLVPRSKGFVASLGALRQHVDSVYDVTIGYPDGVPSLWRWASGGMRRVFVDLRRFPTVELPEEEGLAPWLRDRFEIKDEWLEGFYRQATRSSPFATVAGPSDDE